MGRKRKMGSSLELILKAKAGCVESQNQVIQENMGVIYRLAMNVCPQDPDFYVSVGMEGVLRAIRTFDPNRGYKFITYAGTAAYRNMKRFRQHFHKAQEAGKQHELFENITQDYHYVEPLPSDADEQKDFTQQIWEEAKKNLTVNQWKVLQARMEGRTLMQVGQELGLTKERVRQIQLAALTKLRSLFRAA